MASSLTNGVDQAYQFIQYWVDYGVDLAQWGAGFVPVIGGLVSAQIGIVYDNLVRPIANSFVYNLVDPILNDPSFSSIVNSFGRFGSDIVNSVINFAWAEARYFLPPLPPLPGLALQTTTDANGAAPTSVHEALVPFTKAFKDAEAHFAEALGLTKPDPSRPPWKRPAPQHKPPENHPRKRPGSPCRKRGRPPRRELPPAPRRRWTARNLQKARRPPTTKPPPSPKGPRPATRPRRRAGNRSPRRPRSPRNPPKTQSRTPPCQELRLMPTRPPEI
ncbi:hypothetical protein I540_2752 [Mycobacteroides abscessus subsp. bolletii 1513]|uniref:Uncharacterized protein n=1 Tax=Mycobacteroides abscessus subsp. bolletii 1513 TaxID=1299321 RepID=X8DMQ2_9MYCO|nr:hypothetical protein I540_2752 [Mycobacteroides abscessus subsp. bolletii 1513]